MINRWKVNPRIVDPYEMTEEKSKYDHISDKSLSKRENFIRDWIGSELNERCGGNLSTFHTDLKRYRLSRAESFCPLEVLEPGWRPRPVQVCKEA